MFLEKEVHNWQPRGNFFDLDISPFILTVYPESSLETSLWRIVMHGGSTPPNYFDISFKSCDAAKRYCERYYVS